MSPSTTRLDLTLLLPEVESERDECVMRLVRLLGRQPGVQQAHVVAGEAGESGVQLCLHYDPERLTLARVTELARIAGAGVSDRYAHATLPLHAIGAEDDGRRLADGLLAMSGVTAASVSLPAQVVRVEYDRRRVQLEAIEDRLAALGAAPAPQAPAGAPVDATPSWYERNRELAWSLTAGVALFVGWWSARSNAPEWVSIGWYLVAYGFGARDNVEHTLRTIGKGRFRFNIDFLMVVAAIGAAVLGEWAEGALLLFLFSLGHALEHFALGRARHAIRELAQLAPSRAIVLRDADGGPQEVEVPIESVRPRDRVVVKPGARIPVDGTILEGRSGVNQAPITGESVPVDKQPGDAVLASSINGEGVLIVNVTAAAGDRTLDRIIRLVAEAQTQKAPTQRFTERFEQVFVPLILVFDLLLIVAPPLLGLLPWAEAFRRGMALLVAASPCALALGTPAAVLAGIARAARGGVLIKGGAHLEALGAIKVLALDKTGTITRGEPSVTDLVPATGVTEDVLLATAATVESRSQHPLARAVVSAATARGLALRQVEDVVAVTGRGVRGTVIGDVVEIGRRSMFEENAVAIPDELRAAVERLEADGRSTMLVRSTTLGWLGVLGIADTPRTGIRETLHALRRAGIERVVMLTGDNRGAGEAIGRAVGIDDVRVGLMPEDKVTTLRDLAATGPVAMVGDGVNDAPALANATVGIAMGGAGSAAALETADVALMSDDLGRLPFAIALSHAARGVIRQNLALSLAVIAGLVIATVAGIARIGPAVVVHEGSTLIVIANALRLLTYSGAAVRVQPTNADAAIGV